MSPFHVIIPARLAATRLPRKPLAELAGRALILRVCDVARSAGAQSVHVATDSEEVADIVRADGQAVVMTRADHASGTDRLVEAVELLDLDDEALIVNLQGDEPEMPSECLQQVAALLEAHPSDEMATLWRPPSEEREWRDPNVVKLVADADDRALYFSRSPIPHVRTGGWPQAGARAHIGLYAYRAGALRNWPGLPGSDLQRFEALEQLRALAGGWTIRVARARAAVPAGIDTPDDLSAAQRRLESGR